ncbi:MAG: hypothetical protein E6J86_11260, partial [Deltaproteobacteria bacterium]
MQMLEPPELRVMAAAGRWTPGPAATAGTPTAAAMEAPSQVAPAPTQAAVAPRPIAQDCRRLQIPAGQVRAISSGSAIPRETMDAAAVSCPERVLWPSQWRRLIIRPSTSYRR